MIIAGIPYLPGPPVTGLWGMFERDFGSPMTISPYSRVTPSRVGSILLPFECPNCGATIDFTDREYREAHRDPRPGRTNYWCPSCGWRFYLNQRGKAYTGRVDGGPAPSTVETLHDDDDGMVRIAVEHHDDVHRDLLGLDALVVAAA